MQLSTAAFCAAVGGGLFFARLKAQRSDSKNEAKEATNDAAALASNRLYTIFGGLLTSSTIYVGDQLGIYEEMVRLGPITSKDLAEETGLHERWLHEWLLQNAADKLLTYDPKTKKFALAPGYDQALTNPNSVGLFQMGPGLCARISSLKNVMKDPHGLGEPYDGTFKDDFAKAIERIHTEIYERIIPDEVLPSPKVAGGVLPELMEKGGIRIAEVGCGTASGVVELARRYPSTHFHGFELSEEAITHARNRIARSRVQNATINDVRDSPMESDSFDFVYCHDVIHDCAHPMPLIHDVFRGLRSGGSFFIVDIKTHETDEATIADPTARVRLGFSCGLCLHSGSSEKDGARLGTMGLRPSIFQNMLEEAGFVDFETIHLDCMPANACYIARKP
mmetsp:Transcript_9815/g.19288  ORF Transcript_9815/g.19288 Transcript_9815/m.19288 type:complete len:393 (-) Transcript_9815:75-1253(-)|eukprot:CAMPEP_0171526298 /NCGR_PEP_ID=MMETSP0959-20130129/10304_1 /TAXON_ID=87120 /ORGANISM="Aurantiochytrium limacinum, Strain ATCCMYA-1381" /LENGTH=392 /DNA_ID=CAMNT_0012067683 /DNA_START=229 /DNA_END=1407 /DNA_ORIENTATION=-